MLISLSHWGMFPIGPWDRLMCDTGFAWRELEVSIAVLYPYGFHLEMPG